MSIIIVQGVITKRGEGDYGPWAVVSEHIEGTKGNGDPYSFDQRYMCSGKGIPAEGTRVVVQGFMRSGVREHEGKHYADIKIQAAQFLALGGGQSAQESTPDIAAPAEDLDGEDIPF